MTPTLVTPLSEMMKLRYKQLAAINFELNNKKSNIIMLDH